MFSASLLSVDDLDEKHTVSFPPVFPPSAREMTVTHPADGIVVVDDLLSPQECQHIVQLSQTVGMKDTVGQPLRDAARVILIEGKPAHLRLALESRLSQALHGYQFEEPYGFFTANRTWSHSRKPGDTDFSLELNPCFRVSRYGHVGGFGWHRDAAYTKGMSIKSNYTVLVYLSEQEGATEFLPSDPETVHDGQTVQEELSSNRHTLENGVRVQSRLGRAVVFHQRLLHRGSGGHRFVLRADLLSFGTLKLDSGSYSPLMARIYMLSCELFRHAQYLELEKRYEEANSLYERVISLRQAPHCLVTFPEHLEKLCRQPLSGGLESHPLACDITFRSRTGQKFVFDFRAGPDWIRNAETKKRLVSVAACFVLVSATRALSPSLVENVQLAVERLAEKLDFVEGVAISDDPVLFSLEKQMQGVPYDIRKGRFYVRFWGTRG